jgi:iron complex outermembrane recepter protein
VGLGAKTRAERRATARVGKNNSRAALASAVMLIALAATLAALPVRAQEPGSPARLAQLSAERRFDIPAQPLTTALTLFGQQAGIQVTVHGILVRDIAAPEIRGAMTSREALNRLLAGSGLTYVVADDKTVAIEKSRAEGAGGATMLNPITVEGQAGSRLAEIGNLPREYPGGQVARGGELGFLGNRDIMDTPFNQTSYTDALIQNQQAETLGDVLENDPSVRSNFPGTSGVESFVIRGFEVSNTDVAFGGLYGIAPSYGGTVVTGSIERVEVLKGPNALLNGIAPGGGVGGAINLVPKRAGDEPLTQLTASYVSDTQLGAHIDVGRRFGDEKRFGVRVNGIYRNGDTAIDRSSQETRAAALGADYRGDRVRASADLGYQWQNTEAMRRFVYLAADIPVPDAPDSSSNWSQNWTFLTNENFYGVLRGEVDINDSMTLYAAGGGAYRRVETIRQNPGIQDTAGTITGSALKGSGNNLTSTVETGLRSSLATGFVHHDLTVAYTFFWTQVGNASTTTAVGASNLYNPVFYSEPAFASLPDPEDAPKISEQKNSGVAFADTLSVLDDRVQVIAGVRRQQVGADNFNATTGAKTSSYDQSAWTPAVGLVVKPLPHLSLYGNFIEALQQGQTAPDTTANEGEVFPPFVTRQYEFGAKVDYNGLGATLSAFQITQPSAYTDSATNIFAVDGEQRNRGVELTMFGEVAKGVRVLGGVTYIDAVLTKTQGGVNEGNTAPGVPDVQLNVGAEWDPPFLRGFTVSGRVIYTSSAEYDQANSKEVPAWARLDLGARYALDVEKVPVVIRANVLNVFDNNYWSTTDQWGSLGLSEPRTFLVSATASF